MAISEEVQLLIDRMSEYPEEFVHKNWNPVSNDAWDYVPWDGCRWGHLLSCIYKSGSDTLFTPEEVVVIKEKHTKLIRNKTRNCVMLELVGGERQKSLEEREAKMVAAQNQQMTLPYMPVLGVGQIGKLQGV